MYADHHFQIFLHIVLFALWLGSSVTILVMVCWLHMRGDTPSERKMALSSLNYLVRVPKTVFILMLPMGLQLASNLGLITLATGSTIGVWAFAIIWLGIDWIGAPNRQTATAQAMRIVGRLLQAAFVIVLGGTGVLSLLSGAPVDASWLATKMVIYAGILIVMALFDFSLQRAYPQLEGSSEPVASDKQMLSPVITAAVLLVVTIVLLLVAAWTGFSSWRV